MSGGEDRERERRSSTRSGGLGFSIVKMGRTGLCIGVVGGVESPEPVIHINKDDNEVLDSISVVWDNYSFSNKITRYH